MACGKARSVSALAAALFLSSGAFAMPRCEILLRTGSDVLRLRSDLPSESHCAALAAVHARRSDGRQAVRYRWDRGQIHEIPPVGVDTARRSRPTPRLR